MKLPYLLPLLAVAAAHAEEKTDLATADAYRPQYDFSPPPVITPQTPFGQPLENPFDYQRAWVEPSAAQNVSTNTTRPLQIEASIGNLGDQERLLYTFHTAKGGIAQAGLMVSGDGRQRTRRLPRSPRQRPAGGGRLGREQRQKRRGNRRQLHARACACAGTRLPALRPLRHSGERHRRRNPAIPQRTAPVQRKNHRWQSRRCQPARLTAPSSRAQKTPPHPAVFACCLQRSSANVSPSGSTPPITKTSNHVSRLSPTRRSSRK